MEILLKPGKFSQKGTLVDVKNDDKGGRYQGRLIVIDNQEYLQISHEKSSQMLNIPTVSLSPDQQYYLKIQLGMSIKDTLPLAA